MGYRHISNLYKDQTILMFRECYALEKIHGTSAHVRWHNGQATFSSGGESHVRFAALFDEPDLTQRFAQVGHPSIVVYGEAYGGSQQKQSHRYGPKLRFVAFEVHVGDVWLTVPNAHNVCAKLGIEFVHYVKVSTDLAALDAERDAPSVQAVRNGVETPQTREGVVLRPLVEMMLSNSERVMAKHKRDEERETATPRQVVDPARQQVLADAEAIAMEWVTPTRLEHVLDKIELPHGMGRTPQVIVAMIEDVVREGSGEIVDSKEARQAIGKRAAQLFKVRVKAQTGN